MSNFRDKNCTRFHTEELDQWVQLEALRMSSSYFTSSPCTLRLWDNISVFCHRHAIVFQSKLTWLMEWCRRWHNMEVTKLMANWAPGQTLLPAPHGSRRKSCPFMSTSTSMNLSGQNSNGLFHTAGSRPMAQTFKPRNANSGVFRYVVPADWGLSLNFTLEEMVHPD